MGGVGESDRRRPLTPALELWIPITIAAAFFQNLRTALQKHLTGRLTTQGAAYARFALGLPFALLYLAFLVGPGGYSLPPPNTVFVVYVLLGGAAQILATVALLKSFQYRNFAVGTAYSKTETVQTALVAMVLLAEPLGLLAWLAVVISLAGVLVLSAAKSGLTARTILFGWTEKPALIGLASGGLFGVSAVSYRAASLALGDYGFLVQAATTLVSVLFFQSAVMAAYLVWREPGQLAAVFRHWRWTGWVGLTSMLGSVGWFTAMTLHNAAYVRALGQIELVFTFIASIFFFRERSSLTEVFGVILVVAGIVILVVE